MGRLIHPISGGAPPPPPPDPPPPDPPPNPPTLPALVFSPAGALPGSFWVEGSEWHYIASNGEEWAGTGPAVSTPSGAVSGSFWVEGADFFYVDQSGIVRSLQRIDDTVFPSTGNGSVWVDTQWSTGTQWHWVGASGAVSHWSNGF